MKTESKSRTARTRNQADTSILTTSQVEAAHSGSRGRRLSHATFAALLVVAPGVLAQTFVNAPPASPAVSSARMDTTATALPDAPSSVVAELRTSSSSLASEDSAADSATRDDQATSQPQGQTQQTIPASQAPIAPQPGQPSTSIKPQPVERGIFGLGYSDSFRASHEASTTDKYILPGQLAPRLTVGDKVELGLIHGVSVYSVMGWFVSAGSSHVINTTPNYGTDSGAFGERLGASALRGYSTEVLKDSVMANVFHQDPRYYKMGPRRNPVTRSAYAISRLLVTRGDDGRLAPNYHLLAGNAVGAALTNAYYPSADRGFGQTARTFGSSMYGAGFSFFAAEFLSGALEAVHFKQAKF